MPYSALMALPAVQNGTGMVLPSSTFLYELPSFIGVRSNFEKSIVCRSLPLSLSNQPDARRRLRRGSGWDWAACWPAWTPTWASTAASPSTTPPAG